MKKPTGIRLVSIARARKLKRKGVPVWWSVQHSSFVWGPTTFDNFTRLVVKGARQQLFNVLKHYVPVCTNNIKDYYARWAVEEAIDDCALETWMYDEYKWRQKGWVK